MFYIIDLSWTKCTQYIKDEKVALHLWLQLLTHHMWSCINVDIVSASWHNSCEKSNSNQKKCSWGFWIITSKLWQTIKFLQTESCCGDYMQQYELKSLHFQATFTLMSVSGLWGPGRKAQNRSSWPPPCSSRRTLNCAQASWEIKSHQCVLGLPQGWHPGGILTKSPNHLSCLLPALSPGYL